jgi:hypothetical protein
VIPAARDAGGAYVLDRDSKHFPTILNFLRDGWCSVPATPEGKRQLLQELRYYQVSP